jgi:hypothetical protein
MRFAFALLGFAVFSLSCQSNTVGGECMVDSNCDPGQICYMATSTGLFQDGFCSRGCTVLGNGAECPDSTLCTQDPKTNAYYCTDLCVVATDCRDGYTCNAIAQSTKRGCTN